MESKIMLFADIAKNGAEYDVVTVAKINHDRTIEILDSTTLNVKYNSYEERQAEFNKMVDKIAEQYEASDILKDGEFLEDSEFEKRNKVRKLATFWKPIVIGKGMSEIAVTKFKEEWEKYSHGSIALVSTADPKNNLNDFIDLFEDDIKKYPYHIKHIEMNLKSDLIQDFKPKGKSKFHK